MGTGHSHDHLRHARSRRKIFLVLFLTSGFMGMEAFAGWLTGSLALWADAGHMLADVAALSLSSFAMWMATKQSSSDKTYGYHRAEILAAVCNAVVLLELASWILYEAFTRLYHPATVLGLPVMLVGALGLVVNLVSLSLLSGDSNASINIRSAYLEVLSDAITSIGVVVGGGIIWLTGWEPIDPLLSIVITLFIVWRTWVLLSEAVNILMEGVPLHLNVEEVARAIVQVFGVKEVHDLHIWTITSGRDALSAHIIVSAGRNRDSVLADVQDMLHKRFHIDHLTLQLMEERLEWIQLSHD